MKPTNVLFIILAFAVIFDYSDVLGNDFKLSISYLKGERSRDSYTITTEIDIDGNKVTYSKKPDGYISGKMKDENKSCIISNERLDSVKNYIINNKLNVNDSLFDKSIKYKSYELFTNIAIDLEISGVNTHIRINGDISQFNDTPLYKITMDFISYMQDIVNNC